MLFCLKPYLRLLMLILSLLGMSQAFAVQVNHLYQAQVQVPSNSASNRQEALQKVMAQVFVKLNGNSQITDNAKLTALTQNPNDALLSYSYDNEPLIDGSEGLFLQASFDAQSMDADLKQAGLSIWGRNRPLVLIWLARKTQNSFSILSSQNNGNLINVIKRDSVNRGLPVLFPIMDLTDLNDISPQAILNNDVNTILSASKRYGSDAVLAGTIQENAQQQWQSQWLLSVGQSVQKWTQSADTKDALIKAGINKATDLLAQAYSVNPNENTANTVELTVTNIQNINDYALVTQYLKSLVPVKQVELLQVNAASLQYRLTVQGGNAGLVRALSLDHRLKPVDNTEDETQQPQVTTGLTYQWLV